MGKEVKCVVEDAVQSLSSLGGGTQRPTHRARDENERASGMGNQFILYASSIDSAIEFNHLEMSAKN